MWPLPTSESNLADDSDESLGISNGVRLLTIHPASGFHDPVHCRMFTIHWGAFVCYTALSYSWGMNEDGDDSSSCVIWIDGEMKFVTQNLFEGLKRVREAYGDEHPWLWIDALCINQADPVERTAQVANMAAIFRNATRVIAWLGEGDSYEEDHAVFAMVNCLLEGPSGFHNEAEHSWKGISGESFNICKIVKGEPWKMAQGWLLAATEAAFCLSRWLGRRYFGRLWIVQELFHPAPECIFFHWGAFTLSKTMVKKLVSSGGLDVLFGLEWDADYASGLLDLEFRRNFVGSLVSLSSARLDVRSIVLRENFLEVRLALPAAMTSCWHLECKDPRDKLYALLSLDSDYQISPDYEVSTATVWRRFASALVNKRDLNFLFFLLDQSDTWLPSDAEAIELPSWVPDLRIRWHSYHREPTLSDEGINDLSASVNTDYTLTVRPYFLGIVIEEFLMKEGYFMLTQSTNYHEHVNAMNHTADSNRDGAKHKSIEKNGRTWVPRQPEVEFNHSFKVFDASFTGVKLGDFLCCTAPNPSERNCVMLLLRRSTLNSALHTFAQVTVLHYSKPAATWSGIRSYGRITVSIQ